MPLEECLKLWMYTLLGCLLIFSSPVGSARPRFDTSTDMGLVLVPADAEVDSVIFRLRATDQDADFPLIFDITATVTPIVRIENLPCTLYNKVCQANVILTKRLVPGRLHDFAVRVKDSKGDSNSMQATISVTNATTQRDKIFPHIPAIIMVPEDAKPGKELDYVLVRSNQWSGKPVYIELWQPKELFTIRQRQTPAETRGVITLIGELDFETQSMYSIKMYATDPYTEPKKDTRNIAGLDLVVIVQDVQDVPPIFTMAPPLTKINNTVQPGDIILRVHAEDGDKGVPREVTYGLVSEGNPFTPFFNISEKTGEIILARPLEELTLITHVGAPVVLSVVAEEIRRSTSEPPAQATVVEVGFLLGEPGNSPPFFENDNYVAWIDENAEPGSVLNFTEHYSTKVRDEDIGKAGVFALKLYKNNGTFEISPAVAERLANFIITVRDNSLIDYELHKSLRFEIIAQEVGPATNLSAMVPCTIFIRDINDNVPQFDLMTYEVTLPEDAAVGTRVAQIHATDKDTGIFGKIQYTQILGSGNEAFVIDPNSGIITVAMGNKVLDRELIASLQLSVEARDEEGKGLRGIVPLIVHLLDVNDNPPVFEKKVYDFTLNGDLTNFTTAAIIKAFDMDAEPPNNEIRYELIHGNYENKFYLDELTGELSLREPINKARRTRHNPHQALISKTQHNFSNDRKIFENGAPLSDILHNNDLPTRNWTTDNGTTTKNNSFQISEPTIRRIKRENNNVLFTLTARAYDLGVPHLSGITQVNVLKGSINGARIVSFIVPGENPDRDKTAETLAAITGDRVTVLEIRPFTTNDVPSRSDAPSSEGKKKSIVIARVEPINGRTSVVDIEKIRAALAANGVRVIDGDMSGMNTKNETKVTDGGTTNEINKLTNITSIHTEDVTVYKAENRLLFWLLIILGLLMLLALIILIICCICPNCPFYMAPRKKRVHSSEFLVPRSDGRPKRHLHRKQHANLLEGSWPERKQAWSADPMRRNWQFNRRNQKASGLASLPGDVRALDREQELFEKAISLRLRDAPGNMYPDQIRKTKEERIYIEDFEGARGRDYEGLGSHRHHDPELGLEMPEPVYMNQNKPAQTYNQPQFVREQHFYRDGNAEVLRLVTRGPVEEGMINQPPKRIPTLLIDQGHLENYRSDGKEILLQRFIEDQKHRDQELHHSFQDIEARSMESNQRQKDTINHHQQTKILLLPERLEEDHRQHIEELGPDVQRLIIDHGNYERTIRIEPKENQEPIEAMTLISNAPVDKTSLEKSKEQISKQTINVQHYSLRDLELARQNAILTRLLLEKDGREISGGGLVDSASYLETQSLPGQVAIATQTDRTTATQTELPNRSRSDNDESEEEARLRKKLKSKKRYTNADSKRIRTLWLKSPIEEEEMQYDTEKKTIFLRKKTKDVKDNRRIAIEPDVLREISDSLDECADSHMTVRKKEVREDTNVKDKAQDKKDTKKSEDSSSTELQTETHFSMDKKTSKETISKEMKKKSHRETRENLSEPSFRILEREMSNLSKKLSLLAGKKLLGYSNGSETDSLETDKMKTEIIARKLEKSTKPTGSKKVAKEVDPTKAKRSKSTSQTINSEMSSNKEQTKLRQEKIDDKIRQTSKYRKFQTVSTGSSDYEESVEKLKRSTPVTARIESQVQMPARSYIKGKKSNRLSSLKETVTSSQGITERRDTSDTTSKESFKSHKSGKDLIRMKRSRTGMPDEQPDLISGSASSDSFKEKKGDRKKQVTMKKLSVTKDSGKEAKESEHLSTDYSELQHDADKKISHRKHITTESSNEQTEFEERSDSPSAEIIKQKTAQKEEKLIVRKTSDMDDKEPGNINVIHEVSTSKSPNDEKQQTRDKPILSRSKAVTTSVEKIEVKPPEDTANQHELKGTEGQDKETSKPHTRRELYEDEDKKRSTDNDQSNDTIVQDNLTVKMAEQEKNAALRHKATAETIITEIESQSVPSITYLPPSVKISLEEIQKSPEKDKSTVEIIPEIESQSIPSITYLPPSAKTSQEEMQKSPEKLKSTVETTSEKQADSGTRNLEISDITLDTQTSKIFVQSTRPNTPVIDNSPNQTVESEPIDANRNVSSHEKEFRQVDSNDIQDNSILPNTNEGANDLSGQQSSLVSTTEKNIDHNLTEKKELEDYQERPESSKQVVKITQGMEETKGEDGQQSNVNAEISIAADMNNLVQEVTETVKDHVIDSKDKVMKFLNHEIKDSTQALTSLNDSIIEKIENITQVKSPTDLSVNDEFPSIKDEDQHTAVVELKDLPYSEDDYELEKTQPESQQKSKMEDEAMFSDNFDSFSVIEDNVVNSISSESPETGIPYKPLLPEKFEEQNTMEEVTNLKNTSDTVISEVAPEQNTEDHNKTIIPELSKIEKMVESSLSTIIDDLTKPSSMQTNDRTSSTLLEKQESLDTMQKTTTHQILDNVTDNLNLKATEELEELGIIENIPGSTKSPESQKKEVGSSLDHESQTSQSLETQIPDKKDVDTVETTHEVDFSLKDIQHHPQELMPKTLQKEFGIADSLFVDAKIITRPSSPQTTNTEETSETVSKVEADQSKTFVPPINLTELSRTMLEEAEDSDSSDASNETMLTARPYGTPRHRRTAAAVDTKAVEGSTSADKIITPTKTSESSPGPEKIMKGESFQIINEQSLSHSDSEKKQQSSEQIVDDILEEDAKKNFEIELLKEKENKNDTSEEKLAMNPEKADDKTKVPVESEVTMEDSANQVQLSQIDQKLLSADPDVFTSLTEKEVSVNDSIKVDSDDDKVSTETKKLAEVTMKTVSEIVNVINDDVELASSSTTYDIKESRDNVAIPEGEVLQEKTKSVDTKATLKKKATSQTKIVKEETSQSTEILNKDINDNKGGSSKSGIKIVPYDKYNPKKVPKKRTTRTECQPKSTSKIETHTGKAGPIKKDSKTSVKEVPPKLLKGNILLKQTEYSRDPKRPNIEHQSQPPTTSLSHSERSKHSRQKEAHRVPRDIKKREIPKEEKEKLKHIQQTPPEETQQKEIQKKKIVKEFKEDSHRKGPTNISTKREKEESIRIKKVPEKHKKTSTFKIIPSDQTGKTISEEKVHTISETVDTTRRESKVSDKTISSTEQDTETSLVVETEEPVISSSKEGTATDREDNDQISTEQTSVKDEKPDISNFNISTAEDEISKEPLLTGTQDLKITDEKVTSTENEPSKFASETIERIDMPATVEGEVSKEPLRTSTEDLKITDEKVTSTENEPPKIASETIEQIDIPAAVEEVQGKIVSDEIKVKEELEKETGEEKLKDARTDVLPKDIHIVKTPSPRKVRKSRKEHEIIIIEGQSRYMEWYKQKREETERKKQDRKDGDEEEARPKWLRKRTRQKWIKVGPEDKKIFHPQITPSRRRKIKPLVNVESEQLKAIVRQGRKLRKAQGEHANEPVIQIFAPEKPPPVNLISGNYRCHHLIQHSEYKYEKTPISSFYLHPPLLNAQTQIGNQNLEDPCCEQKMYSSLPTDSKCPVETYHTGIDHRQEEQQHQGEKRLRHGELLEKKSVFDLAYNEAAPSQLRSDSTTPPS